MFEGTWESSSVSEEIASGYISIEMLANNFIQVRISYAGIFKREQQIETKIEIHDGQGSNEFLSITIQDQSQDLITGSYTSKEVVKNTVIKDKGTFKLHKFIICSDDYYRTYNGHEIKFLKIIHNKLRSLPGGSVVWLAGDSSLDNKYWIKSAKIDSPEIYREILPQSYPDVAYHMSSLGIPVINTAVEASTLIGRQTEQDEFLAAHIQPQDTLIVSVGANDIALKPSPMTIYYMAIILMTPLREIPTTSSFQYFKNLFGESLKSYIMSLTRVHKPKKICVCCIYYPCTAQSQASWATLSLRLLGYDRDPAKLQHFIQLVYAQAISQIKIDGTEVIPVPLYEILDANDPQDYISRVEPSSRGGRKMAAHFHRIITALKQDDFERREFSR